MALAVSQPPLTPHEQQPGQGAEQNPALLWGISVTTLTAAAVLEPSAMVISLTSPFGQVKPTLWGTHFGFMGCTLRAKPSTKPKAFAWPWALTLGPAPLLGTLVLSQQCLQFQQVQLKIPLRHLLP